MGESEGDSNVNSLISIQKKKLQNKHVSAILNGNGQMIEEEGKKRETIRDLCEKMYQKIPIDEEKVNAYFDSIDLSEVGRNSVGGEITKNEVREAISLLSKGKSPGPDGLPNEVYLSCTEDLVDLLTSALNDGIKSYPSISQDQLTQACCKIWGRRPRQY